VDEIKKHNRERIKIVTKHEEKLRYRLTKLNSQKKTLATLMMIKKLKTEKKKMLKKYPQMVSFYCGNGK